VTKWQGRLCSLEPDLGRVTLIIHHLKQLHHCHPGLCDLRAFISQIATSPVVVLCQNVALAVAVKVPVPAIAQVVEAEALTAR
jgi:hypothetical protein